MTDYNDGKWHGWNGGERPVHPKSTVVVKWSCNGVETSPYDAASFSKKQWSDSSICAFRVVKEHRDPREWWINPRYEDPIRSEDPGQPGFIRVREVLE